MDKCDTADATVNACNSIVIHRNSQISNRCQLHDVAVGENNVTSTSSETSQYFNKPHWYRGVCKSTMVSILNFIFHATMYMYLYIYL
mgnify:CR=1 FL=1